MRFRRNVFVRSGGVILAVVAIGAWWAWLRPEALGGRVDYVIVSGRSMLPSLHGGDLLMVQERRGYGRGDVVAYRIPTGVFRGRRIIHRIVGGDAATGFVVRGDNNRDTDQWRPRPSDIEGRLYKRLPAVGRAVAFVRAPAVLAAVVSGFVFAFVMTWKREEDGTDPEPDGSPALS